MLRQNDERLNPISTWGCAFCSCLYIIEKVTEKTFSPKEILNLWFLNLAEGDIDIESSMENWQGVINDVVPGLKYLGHFSPNYVPSHDEYEILLYEREDGYKHFVVGDGQGCVEWDPWENSRTVSEGKLTSKRIFKRI